MEKTACFHGLGFISSACVRQGHGFKLERISCIILNQEQYQYSNFIL